MKLRFKGWNIRSEMLLTILLGNPHIFTRLFTWSFSGCIRIIARRVFKCVTLFYTKGLIRRQVLCDCILVPKRYSYTQGYLLEVQIENFHCTSANHLIFGQGSLLFIIGFPFKHRNFWRVFCTREDGFPQNRDTVPVLKFWHWTCNWIFFTLQHVIWSSFSALRWIFAIILGSAVVACCFWWPQHRKCKEIPTMLIYRELRRKQWQVDQTSRYTMPSLPWTSASTSTVKSILMIPLHRERKALQQKCETIKKL